MADHPEREEKHVPMQHQSDFNQDLFTLTGGTLILPIKMTQRELDLLGFQERIEDIAKEELKHFVALFGVPVKYSPFVPPGKAVLDDGKELKVFDLPQAPENEEEQE